MLSRNFALSLIMSAACILGVSAGAHAADDGNPPPNAGGKHHGGGAGRLHFILQHAADLNLTDDQKKSIQALADSAKDGTTKPEDVKAKLEAILTPDQVAKLKALGGKHGEKGGEKGGDGDKKDGTPAPGGDAQK